MRNWVGRKKKKKRDGGEGPGVPPLLPRRLADRDSRRHTRPLEEGWGVARIVSTKKR